MVLQNYAFTVSSLLPRLLLHWPTKKCSPLSQSTKYTDSSTVETTPRAPGRGQNQSRSALNSASHSGERRRGVALTHAEVVRRDGCWQSDGLADLDGAGARGGLQLPALHRGAPCARHSQRQRQQKRLAKQRQQRVAKQQKRAYQLRRQAARLVRCPPAQSCPESKGPDKTNPTSRIGGKCAGAG